MKIPFFYPLWFICFFSFSQENSDLINPIPREKVYLNTNKPFYVAGDSIKLEATIADARTFQTDTLSVPLYVELIDNSKSVLMNRWILKLVNNKAILKFKIPNYFKTNYYQLRAYTNWMQNFGVDTFSNYNVLIFSSNYLQAMPKILPEIMISSIDVAPEGGACVSGLVNNLYVQTKDNFQKGLKSLVTLREDTTAIRVFDTDDNGEALVEFIPTNGKKYQVEVGEVKTEIPVSNAEGVVLRGYFTNEGKKMLVSVQNNLKEELPLKMVLQVRGEVAQTLMIKPQKDIVILNFETSTLPEGILNVAIIDLDDKILVERAFLVAHTDKDAQQNYFLFNSELNSPIKSTNRFYTEIAKANTELIAKKNILYSLKELNKVVALPYKNELGISVTGKVLNKMEKDFVNVSLIIIPEQKDTLHKKQIFVTLSDKDGNFSFENLDFHGQAELYVQASIGKNVLKAVVQKDSIPSIITKKMLIDWREFIQPSKLEELKKEASLVFENTALEERMKVKELEEVTVTSKKEPKSPLTIFTGDPTVRFLPAKLTSIGQISTFKDFYKYFVAFRLTKHLTPVVKFYVDEFLMTEDQVGEIPNDLIAYVDVHDSTSDSNMIGASILLNIYTKGYLTNPMVRKITGKGGDSLMMKVQRNGYYVAN